MIVFFEQFEKMLLEFDDYKHYMSISVLAVTLKLFEYFYQSKAMMQLLNVMTSVKVELANFLIIFQCISFGFLAFAFLSFGHFDQNFANLTDSFICIFEISLQSPIDYGFLDKLRRHSPVMTWLLFLPMTIIFMFIFRNLFLAIMMNSYEINIGQWRHDAQQDDDSEEMSLLKSLLCCTIPKEGTADEKEKTKHTCSHQNVEDDVLGIDQTPKMWRNPKTLGRYGRYHDLESPNKFMTQLVNIAKVPEYMVADFDPHDPNSKYNEEDYLGGLDELDVDMQMSNRPIKSWTTDTAKEIYAELTKRSAIRQRAKQLMEEKFQFLQMSRSQRKANPFDEFTYQQRRIEYWNYIRIAS